MNNILKGFLIILLMLLIGGALNYTIIPILPSSVIGMVLLFATLQLKIVKEESVRAFVEFIVGNMSMFFIPPAVGIVVAMPLIKGELLPISITIIVSTVAVLLSVGATHQWINRKKK